MSYFSIPYQRERSFDRSVDHNLDYQSMPMTPMAMEYLPSNLINSPQLQLYPPSQHSLYSPNINNPHLTISSNTDTTLNQLNISRTVILKNLDNNLKLEHLLNFIDFGPIEYCKIISKQQNKIGSNNEKEIYKICFISFTNSKISINFYLKYNNSINLNKLKLNLGSEHLKIQLNDNKVNHMKDLIKLKTLNYINEFNATRSLEFGFKYLNSDPESDRDPEQEESFLLNQFFKLSIDHEHFESNQAHFLSIDSSIKVYEFFNKLIHTNHEKLLNNEQIQEPFLVISCKFIRDRCDKTLIDNMNRSDSSSPSPENDILNGNVDNTILDYNELSSLEEESDQEFNGSHLSSSMAHHLSSAPHHHLSSPATHLSTPHLSVPYLSAPHLSAPYLSSPGIRSAPVGGSTFDADYDDYYYNSLNYNPDPFNVGNRTIYLGNLHPQSTVEEIANNVRAGGLIESIKYYPERRNCFITFIDPNVALKFYLNHQVLHQLIIHGYDINVGWAKTHSGPLNREISLAVTAGGSRNVYIGIKVVKAGEPPAIKPTIPNADQLRQDFEPFGELEQINFYHNNDCAFLNFCQIIDAITLVELFDLNNSGKLNEITNNPGFYDKYKEFKISFGKDRCGNPPKYSFKKKFGKYRQKVYFDKSFKEKERKERAQEKDEITDEAALVFGIIKDDGDSKPEEAVEQEQVDEKTDDEQQVKDNEPRDIKNGDILADQDNDNRDSGNDNEDDISIIIGSDDTSSTTANNSNDNKEKKKFYNNLVNSSDPFIPIRNRRTNSNLSLNKYKHHYHPNSHPQQMAPPQYYQQHPYMTNSMPSPYGAPSHMVMSPQQYGYVPFYPSGPPTPVGGQFGQSFMTPPHMSHGPVSQRHYYDGPPTPNGRGSISGSQVMAQYLAKSQSDNLYYQPMYEDSRRKK